MNRLLTGFHILQPFFESDETIFGGHDGVDFEGFLAADERVSFVVCEPGGAADFLDALRVAGGADEEMVCSGQILTIIKCQ